MCCITPLLLSPFSLSLVSSVCVCVCVCARMIDLSRQLHSSEAVSQFGLTCISAPASIFVQLLQQTKERENSRQDFYWNLGPGLCKHIKSYKI